MRTTALFTIAIGLLTAPLAAQEPKPVPKDSARVSITGCSKGYVFTAGPRSVEHPGSVDVPEGMHLRMNGPKSVIADIKARCANVTYLPDVLLPPSITPTSSLEEALARADFVGSELRTSDGKNAGRITSATFSLRLDKTVALGYVRYDYLAEGTELVVNDVKATVTTLPFISSTTEEKVHAQK